MQWYAVHTTIYVKMNTLIKHLTKSTLACSVGSVSHKSTTLLCNVLPKISVAHGVCDKCQVWKRILSSNTWENAAPQCRMSERRVGKWVCVFALKFYVCLFLLDQLEALLDQFGTLLDQLEALLDQFGSQTLGPYWTSWGPYWTSWRPYWTSWRLYWTSLGPKFWDPIGPVGDPTGPVGHPTGPVGGSTGPVWVPNFETLLDQSGTLLKI